MMALWPVDVAPSGDDRPAANVWGYVWRMSGWRQVALAAAGVTVAAMELAPIELQRRMVDNAIARADADLLWRLGIVYAVVLLLHQTLKFAMSVAQGWLSESAVRHTRRHLLRLHRGRGGGDRPGEAVSIIGGEVETLGGFVGEGPSQAVTDAAILLSVLGYMAWVAPQIAAVSLCLLIPQLALAPLLQGRLNRLVERQLAMKRDFGETVADGGAADDLLARLYGNRMLFHVWKNLLKQALNLLNAAAPLVVLLWGGWLVVQGQTSIGVIVAFLSGFDRISGPIRDLIAFYRLAAQAEVQHAMMARWMEAR